MKTIIIVGKQGCGKTTLAEALLKTYHNPRSHLISNRQATDLVNIHSNPTINEIAKLTQNPVPHSLFIDETDNFFSYLTPPQKKYFVAYWAVARHYQLQLAIFITRRYIQIPIQLRTSADEVFITSGITGYDLDRISRDRGIELDVKDFNKDNLTDYSFCAIC